MSNIEFNDQFERAFRLMEESSKNLFITGKAGTGKSTLLDYFRNKTKKNVVVLAPTGVAAINVKGQTIHSFFQFKPGVVPSMIQKVSGKLRSKSNIYKELDAIIIDEISMVRADLLDCVDMFLRLNGPDKYQPFGGIQMLLFGDLYQLPPVVTPQDKEWLAERYQSPYFFDANVFSCLTLEVIQLDKVYRQRDTTFIDILNAVRANTVSMDHLNTLNERFTLDTKDMENRYYLTLATTNALADEVNETQLNRLPGGASIYDAVVSGDFLPKDAPTALELSLKIGSQVMLLNNDQQRRWVNGSIGKITQIKREEGESDTIIIDLAEGKQVEVTPHTWESHAFNMDETTKRVEAQATGAFTQYPLKLAWAVTIHKSQGKTFDRVIIDLGRGTFAHGQLYVALSRCTSLEGIYLKQTIQRRHIIMDPRIHAFMQQFATNSNYRGAEAIDAPQQFSF